MTDFGEDFPEYLKAIRQKKNLSMRGLAELSGISHAYISQLESGKRDTPKPDLLKKLANGLGIKYEDIMLAAGYIVDSKSINSVPTIVDLHEILTEEGHVYYKDREVSESEKRKIKSLIAAFLEI